MNRIFALLIGLTTANLLYAQYRSIPIDTSITTEHQITVNNQSITYRATAGTQPVWNDKGMPIATLNYTLYERDGISDRSQRPLVISFNGGPGFWFGMDAFSIYRTQNFEY